MNIQFNSLFAMAFNLVSFAAYATLTPAPQEEAREENRQEIQFEYEIQSGNELLFKQVLTTVIQVDSSQDSLTLQISQPEAKLKPELQEPLDALYLRIDQLRAEGKTSAEELTKLEQEAWTTFLELLENHGGWTWQPGVTEHSMKLSTSLYSQENRQTLLDACPGVGRFWLNPEAAQISRRVNGVPAPESLGGINALPVCEMVFEEGNQTVFLYHGDVPMGVALVVTEEISGGGVISRITQRFVKSQGH